jgi:hypothetical protein
MKLRRGDRRYGSSLWRSLLGWLLRERRDGWDRRTRVTEKEAGLAQQDREVVYTAGRSRKE